MTDLEKKKIAMQLKRVDATVAELEYKIEERKLDIERIREHISLQKEQEQKLKDQLGL
jgi:hypothetical protein